MCQEKYYGPKGFAGFFNFGPHEIAKMKQMARHFMHGFMGSYIPFNIEDLGDSYLITVPLAGRTKEEIKVSLINKLKDKNSDQDWCMPFFRKGFSFIDVDMDIPLPSDADTETLVSKMSNGLLKITMGKKPAKKIDISEN